MLLKFLNLVGSQIGSILMAGWKEWEDLRRITMEPGQQKHRKLSSCDPPPFHTVLLWGELDRELMNSWSHGGAKMGHNWRLHFHAAAHALEESGNLVQWSAIPGWGTQLTSAIWDAWESRPPTDAASSSSRHHSLILAQQVRWVWCYLQCTDEKTDTQTNRPKSWWDISDGI